MSDIPLLRLKNSSWVLKGPTNIGIVEDGGGVYLIDSGCDIEAGKNILNAVGQKGWKIRGIISTHSNADHMGGNNHIQADAGCEIWATKEEAAFIENPFLEECLFWGGYPFRDLHSKFYAAAPSRVTRIIEPGERSGRLKFIPLPGHFFSMTGVYTDDNIFYTADAIYDEYVLNKFKIPYILDVPSFRETLYKIKNIEAELYVPSHGEVLKKIDTLVNFNIFRLDEIEESILDILKEKLSFDDIAQKLCRAFDISPSYSKFIVICNTIRSYLAYLCDSKKISHCMRDNKMLWEAVRQP